MKYGDDEYKATIQAMEMSHSRNISTYCSKALLAADEAAKEQLHWIKVQAEKLAQTQAALDVATEALLETQTERAMK
jgi:3-methyladenine DNA glycosylase AlkC